MNHPEEVSAGSAPLSTSVVGGNLVVALVAGFVAASIGAAAWGAVAYFANYELGILAWAIGGGVGFAVGRVAGCVGLPAQVIAVCAALFSILGGKYAAFYSVLNDQIKTELGAEGAAAFTAEFGFFSLNAISGFASSLPEMLSPFDALWVILAVGSAWKLTSAEG